MPKHRFPVLWLAFLLVSMSVSFGESAARKQARYLDLRKQGDVKADANDSPAALSLYLKAKALAPEDPGIHYRLATTAGKLHRADLGLEAINNLIRLDPKAAKDPEIQALKASFEFPASSSAKLNPQARLELETLLGMSAEAKSATDLQQKRKILIDFMDRSSPFLETHPEVRELWMHRGVAALALNRPHAGWEAGQKLLALGALESSNEQERGVLAKLNRQNWLGKEPPTTSGATAGQSWENSLGMKFVPVADLGVLFCVWETRIRDYAVYAKAFPNADDSWQHAEWKGVTVGAGPDYPVTMVSWEDAHGFCEWLTRKERAEGKLSAAQQYRLPTDLEWSIASGLSQESGATPAERSAKAPGVYPWGRTWPPPRATGNFADESAKATFPEWKIIEGYDDGFATTAPVGSFLPNQFGLFDLSGNVSEWCEDLFHVSEKSRVLRGGSWVVDLAHNLLSSYRYSADPSHRRINYGFRCVLEVGTSDR